MSVNCSISELFFGIVEGRDRQRSPGSSHLSLESYQAESAAFPSPTEKLARAAETQTMKGACSSQVTRREVSSLGSTATKAWNMPSRAGGSSGQRVTDPPLPRSTTLPALHLRGEQGGYSLGVGFFCPNGLNGLIKS